MGKRFFRLLVISGIIMVVGWGLARGDNYYGMANDYLQYGAGARSLAMGGAYVALADEASAPYWNPAALIQIDEHQFLSMYAPFFEQTSYNFLSYVHPLRRWGSIGISDVLLHSGGYEEVRLVEGVVGTNKSVYKNAVIISYANRVYRQISLGASLKLLHERVMRYSGNGQGIDLGILYEPLDELNIGLVLQNVIQPKVTLRDEPDEYKVNLKAGLALSTFSRRLTLTSDINKLVDEKAYFCAGIEVCPWEKATASLRRVDLRVGCNHLQSFTCGIGLKIKFLTVDYGFSSHDLGNLHKFGVTFSWGNIYKASAKPILKAENTYGLEALSNELEFSTDIPSITVKKWSLEIRDEVGEVVKSFSGETRPGEIISWDVCDDMGRPVKRGDYTYKFSVVYKNDREWVDQGEIKLQSFPQEETPVEMKVSGEELTDQGVPEEGLTPSP